MRYLWKYIKNRYPIYRICKWLSNKLFNRLDICDDCIGKIKRLSIDKKDEEKYIKEVFDKAKDYDNPDMKSAYYKGIEDTLNVLSHKRLKNLQK